MLVAQGLGEDVQTWVGGGLTSQNATAPRNTTSASRLGDTLDISTMMDYSYESNECELDEDELDQEDMSEEDDGNYSGGPYPGPG